MSIQVSAEGEQDMDEIQRNIIDSLPDEILCHILSFLPSTKDAVRTSILSTRWRYIWTYLPKIDLHYYNDDCVAFLNFLDTTLLHRSVPSLTKFSLGCSVCYCPFRVFTYISSAIWQNVKNLELVLLATEQFVLPSCVFHCKTLETLKIDMKCTLRLPLRISLPELEMLDLGKLEFSDEESIYRLFSACTSLTELYLRFCDLGRLNSCIMSIPTLRRLWISGDKTDRCIIKVEAPQLVAFEYFGSLPNEILIEQFSLLTEVKAFVEDEPLRRVTVASHAFKLFNKFQNVQVLELSTRTTTALSEAQDSSGPLPAFKKLTNMKLYVHSPDSVSVLKFLFCCSQLETLAFHGRISLALDLFNGHILRSASSYKWMKLKIISLHLFQEKYMPELQYLVNVHVLMYLVKNAPALQKISIIPIIWDEKLSLNSVTTVEVLLKNKLQHLRRNIAIVREA